VKSQTFNNDVSGLRAAIVPNVPDVPRPLKRERVGAHQGSCSVTGRLPPALLSLPSLSACSPYELDDPNQLRPRVI